MTTRCLTTSLTSVDGVHLSFDTYRQLPEPIHDLVSEWAEQPDLIQLLIREVTLTAEDGREGDLLIYDQPIRRSEHDRYEAAQHIEHHRWTVPFPLAALPYCQPINR